MLRMKTLAAGTGLALALMLPCHAVCQETPKASDAKRPDASAQTTPAPPPAPAEAKPTDAASTRDAERQAKIKADTDKLCQLIQELKDEVAKSNKDTLSVAVVKKAAEIEKLAKSLKERMRPQ